MCLEKQQQELLKRIGQLQKEAQNTDSFLENNNSFSENDSAINANMNPYERKGIVCNIETTECSNIYAKESWDICNNCNSNNANKHIEHALTQIKKVKSFAIRALQEIDSVEKTRALMESMIKDCDRMIRDLPNQHSKENI